GNLDKRRFSLNALLSRKLVDVPPPEVVHQEP
ncbi:hypothetical protein, partial [Escherichia coli]